MCAEAIDTELVPVVLKKTLVVIQIPESQPSLSWCEFPSVKHSDTYEMYWSFSMFQAWWHAAFRADTMWRLCWAKSDPDDLAFCWLEVGATDWLRSWAFVPLPVFEFFGGSSAMLQAFVCSLHAHLLFVLTPTCPHV